MTTTSLSDRHLPSVHVSARSAALGFAVGLLGGIVLLIAASLGVALAAGDGVMPRVSVGDVAIGGLSADAAAQRLAEQLPPLTHGTLTVRAAGESVEVPYQRFARTYDLDAMAAAGLAVGRDPNPIVAGMSRLRAALNDTSLAPIVSADTGAVVDELVGELAARFASLATSATVRPDGASFRVVPGTDGQRLDLAALRRQLAAIAADPSTAHQTLDLRVVPILPGVSTAEAQAAADDATAMTAAPITMLSEATTKAGDAVRLDLSPAELRELITFRSEGGRYVAALDSAGATKVIGKLAAAIAAKPRDAGFTFNANGISGVTPAVTGRELDVDASVRALASALQARVVGGEAPSQVELAVSVTQPPLTTEAAEAALPKMKRISTWTTHYVPGISNFWGRNISIPAHDLDGEVLAPGEWFDFWSDIGPVTIARGYGQGGAIIGGKSEPTGALAGGICSTSTTIFNAALRAGLAMGERRNHYYYINRYPLGLDATVFQTDGYTLTMTFQNDTPDPIVIRSYTGSGWVRFDLWGVPTGRTVTLTKPIVRNVRYATDVTEVDASMKPGTSIRLETPHNGMDVSVTRYVRDAAGQLIHTDLFTSHYSPVNGRLVTGPKPTPPPPKPDPTPETPPSPA